MHPWKARLLVGLVMIILAFVGLVITDIHKGAAWIYWRYVAALFAVLCIGLSAYLRHHGHVAIATIWHEVAHWIGMGLAIYLVAFLVNLGIVGQFEAALLTLTLLALSTFLAGVYIEFSLIIVGLLLGFFVAAAAYLEEYLYSILLPVTLGVIGVLVYSIYHRHKRRS